MSPSGIKFRDVIGLVMTGRGWFFISILILQTQLPNPSKGLPTKFRDQCSPLSFAPIVKLVDVSWIGLDCEFGKGRYRRHVNDIVLKWFGRVRRYSLPFETVRLSIGN